MKKLFIDFETRSAADLNSKKKNAVSAWMYSKNPSTKILSTAYKIWEENAEVSETKIWKNLFEDIPQDLKELLEDDSVQIYAHNVNFESSIIENQLAKKHKLSIVPKIQRYKDTQHILAYNNYRLSLELGAKDANLSIHKDKSGDRLIKLLSMPQKPAAGYYKGLEEDWAASGKDTIKVKEWIEKYGHYETDEYGVWDNNPKLFEELYKYNICDVDVTYALWEKLGDLPADEDVIATINTEINYRGIPIDVKCLHNTIELIDIYLAGIREEFSVAVGGAFAPSQIKRLKEYLAENGVFTAKLDVVAVNELLKNPDLDEHIFHVISLLKSQNLRSLDKFKALAKLVDDDGRLRHEFVYAGAGQTHRDSAKGVQAQNAFRGKLKHAIKCKNIVKSNLTPSEKIEQLVALENEPIQNILQKLFRPLISAPDDKGYIVEADWSAIEARMTFEIVGNMNVVQKFKDKECLYCDLATTMFGVKITKADADKRQFGKRGILGCGYGAGGAVLAKIWKKDGFVLQNKEEMDKFIGGKAEREALLEKIDGVNGRLWFKKGWSEPFKEIIKSCYRSRGKWHTFNKRFFIMVDDEIELHIVENQPDGNRKKIDIAEYINAEKQHRILEEKDGILICETPKGRTFACADIDEFLEIKSGLKEPKFQSNHICDADLKEEIERGQRIKNIKQLQAITNFIRNTSGIAKLKEDGVDVIKSEEDLYLALISQKIVNVYRAKYPDVSQYANNLLDTFYNAYDRPNMWHDVPSPHEGAKSYVAYMYNSSSGVMSCRKPSGKFIFYKDVKHSTRINVGDEPEDDTVKVDKRNLEQKKKDARNRTPLTYKGKKEGKKAFKGELIDIFISAQLLIGHVVQSSARDLFAEACERIRNAGYDIFMKKHDEIVLYIYGKPLKEVLKIIDELMRIKPDWAKLFVVDVEVEFGKCYNEGLTKEQEHEYLRLDKLEHVTQ